MSGGKSEEMNKGGAAIVVYDDSFENFHESDFKRFLDAEGFLHWRYGRNFDTSWVYININSKIYARGMPGINVAAHLGEHVITIDEFKTIYNIFKKYEGLPFLQME